MSDMKLTIGISTMSNKKDELLNKIKLYSRYLNDEIFFLIVSQNESYDNSVKISENIILISTSTIGLSVSRNIVINNTQTEWLWFQDDDIELNFREIKKITNKLDPSLDLFFIRIGSLENSNKLYKKYSNYTYESLLPLKISSIEIIAKVHFLKSKNIKFNENLGLGTKLPCCEENLFIRKMLLDNANYKCSKIVGCYHTTSNKFRLKKNQGHFIARGCLLRYFNPFIAFFIAIRWSIREFGGFGFIRSFLLMTNGYLHAEDLL
ncbi:TPA: glycosyltransferase [Photobacterium damselae]